MLQPIDSAPACARAFVGRLHDPRPAAGDDGEAGLAEQLGGLDRGVVVLVGELRARRPEDRHGRIDLGEMIEAGHELARDPQHAPRLALQHLRAGRPVEQLAVLERLARLRRNVDFVVSAAGRLHLTDSRPRAVPHYGRSLITAVSTSLSPGRSRCHAVAFTLSLWFIVPNDVRTL